MGKHAMTTDKPQANVIQGIELQNFTAFRQLKLDGFGRLNAIIGLNDTGKTQLLKALYFGSYEAKKFFTNNSVDTKPNANKLMYLLGDVGRFSLPNKSSYRINYLKDAYFSMDLDPENSIEVWTEGEQPFLQVGPTIYLNKPEILVNKLSTVFIPAKEELGIHTAILESRSETGKRLKVFDDSYYDLAKLLALTPDNEGPLPLFVRELLDPLMKVTSKHLSVSVEGSKVSFFKGLQDIPNSQTPEGPKKALLLQQLFKKQILDLDEHNVLFIDEPEANLHADAVVKFADVLHQLATMGVQIFLATHSYFLMKRLEQLAKEDELNDKPNNNQIIDLYRDPVTDEICAKQTPFKNGLPADSAMLRQFDELFATDMRLDTQRANLKPQ